MIRKWQIIMCVCAGLALVLGSVWAPQAIAKKYKWRLTQVMPVDSDQHRRALAFAEEVKEKNRRSHYYSSTLGWRAV